MIDAEPISVFSYWDFQFIFAEDTFRGWVLQLQFKVIMLTATHFNEIYCVIYARMDAAYIAADANTSDIALIGTVEQKVAQIII